MEFVIVAVAVVLFLGAMATISVLVGALLQGALRLVFGPTVQDEVAEALHRERVLLHFERMRAAALAGDEARVDTLTDELMELDVQAWASFRHELEQAGGTRG